MKWQTAIRALGIIALIIFAGLTAQYGLDNRVILMDGTRKTVYRLRSGSYRVVFTCEGGKLLVWRVGERRNIYQDINQTYEQVPA